MNKTLHYETVTPQLRQMLINLMQNPMFNPFVLVGGTSLSLRFGHRISQDIDLFTNAPYGSLDYGVFEQFFKEKFPYASCSDSTNIVGFGRSYYLGNSSEDNVKVDLYYHDEISDAFDIIDGIRIASVDDIVAMKVDVISRGGRKKDFWDLYELLDHYSIIDMLNLHEQRYEYTHVREEINNNFTDFSIADEELDPKCLRGNIWELIKLEFVEKIKNI
jgi:predicted nucleotidyltransferase component of viral defense system